MPSTRTVWPENRGIEARDRLTRVFRNGEDIFDDLPLVLQEVSELFAERAHRFINLSEDTFELIRPVMRTEIEVAALAFSSYFDAFTTIAHHQEFENGSFRHVALKAIGVAYECLACQSFTDTSIDSMILPTWQTVIMTARPS